MNTKNTLGGLTAIILISVLIGIGIFILSQIIEGIDYATPSITQVILGQNSSQHTLSQKVQITSSITAHNRTWLTFDGIDDYIYLSDNSYKTISFWVKNATHDWQHIVNTSGILYQNGTEVISLLFYPVYFNSTDWEIGKIDATTFFPGSVDKIKFYNNTINSSIVSELFAEGRA